MDAVVSVLALLVAGRTDAADIIAAVAAQLPKSGYVKEVDGSAAVELKNDLQDLCTEWGVTLHAPDIS